MIPHLPYYDFLKNWNNKNVRYKIDDMDEVEEGGVLNKRKKKNCYLTCKKIWKNDENG